MENYYSNSAYVAGLEILFLNRLYKLRQDILIKDFEQVRQTAAEFQLEYEEHIESNYILFKSKNTRLKTLIRILEFSLELKKMFTCSKNIFEFNILIFKTNIDTKLITQKIHKLLLKTPSDNRVWILQENNPIIRYSAEVSFFDTDVQELIAIKQEYSQKNFLEEYQERVLSYAGLVDTVNRSLQNSNALGIVGKPCTGKTAFLRRLCQKENYIYLTAHSLYQEPYYPFIILLYHLKKYFSFCFQDSQKQRLENLLQQIQLISILNYEQVEVDICGLIQHLVGQRLLVLTCDNLDNWPIEAIELLQLIYQKLGDGNTQLKLICCLTGISYPIRLDEIIHFADQRNHLASSEQPALIPYLESCRFSIKERLLAIFPSERVNVKPYSDFHTLITEGLKTQELLVLSIVQRYPYVFNRNILAKIFQDSIIYEVVDYLLDYYFLLEIEDHFGKHLFCALNKEIYPLKSVFPEVIQENIVNFFGTLTFQDKMDIYSLYILSQNNISLYECLDYYLYKILSYGFTKTVRRFLDSNIFGNYHPAIEMWDMIHKKSLLDLVKIQGYFDAYLINKDNICFLLPLSKYYYQIHNYEKSLKINKESIYLFNNDPVYKIYIKDVFLIQAKIFISKCMFKEAIEYVNIGLESFQSNKRSHLFYKFIYLKILCLFFEKKLHSVISITEKYDFSEYLNLYGQIESYFQVKLLIMRIHFEIGQYLVAKDILVQLAGLAKYYSFEKYFHSIHCWAARMSFYAGKLHQGFQFLEPMVESEEKLYFLSEGYYFYDEKEKALRCAMLALRLSLKNAKDRENIGNKDFDNVYSLHEGLLFSCNGEKDPLLVCIQGLAAYLHTFYGSPKTAERILNRIIQRPSPEFKPFQHIFHYFYYLYLKTHSQNDHSEDMLYLSYAISILQNDSSKILNTKIRYNYIYNNYWNNLLSIEGEQHNLLILNSSRIR